MGLYLDGRKVQASQSVTNMVAASDARLEIREMADDVCDGVADDAQIQAAIDGLPT